MALCKKWLRNSLGKRYKRIRICVIGKVEMLSSPIWRQNSECEHPGVMATAAEFRMWTSGWNGSGSRIPDVDIRVEWRRQPDSGCNTSWWKVAAAGCNGGSQMKWRQSDGITTRVE